MQLIHHENVHMLKKDNWIIYTAILMWIVSVFLALQMAAAPQEVGVGVRQYVNQRDRSVKSISM